MEALLNYLKAEPVRAYGYSVVVAVLGLLAFLGVVSAGAVPILVAVAGVVLSVGGTEAVRKSVTPVYVDPNRTP
jgi:hypothetical protein